MMRVVVLAWIMAGGASFASFDGAGDEPRHGLMSSDPEIHTWLRANEISLRARVDRVQAEAENLPDAWLVEHPWAGEWAGVYRQGDGRGENVTIALSPKQGIAYTHYGCLGLYGADFGEIEEVLPDGLRLKLKLGSAKHSFLSERMYFVRWGDRRYLVPDWLMMDLVNKYNQGGLSRAMMTRIPLRTAALAQPRLMRPNDTPPGRPELPEEFAKLLRDGPIRLKITGVSAVSERPVVGPVVSRTCSIDFEGGTDVGVYLGMELWYTAGGILSTGQITIDCVDERRCSGRLTVFNSAKHEFRAPVVGESMRTGGPVDGDPGAASDEPKPAAESAPPPAGDR